MLQRLKLSNFIRVPYLDLEVQHPVLFIAGPNEAGKSSIAEAIRFAMFGVSPRVKYKKDYAQLVTNGAKTGAVEITFDNYTVKRNVKDGKGTGDLDAIPTDLLLASICLGASRFVDLPEKERRGLIMRLLKVEITPEKITAELRQRGIGAATIKRYEPIYKNGIPAAFDKANRITQEGRGEWKGVTGDVYGPDKAEGWKPADPLVAVDEVRSTQAELDREIVELQAARDNELAPIHARIAELTTEIDAPRSIRCPVCSAEVRYQGGKLHVHSAPTDDARKSAEQSRLIAYKKRDDIVAKHNETLQGKLADRAALDEQLRQHTDRERKIKRAAEIHAEIKDAEVMRLVFGEGPDGIMGRAVGEALKRFNGIIDVVAKDVGWQAITLGADMEIMRVDHVPYGLLSESAQWRADLLVNVALSALTQFPWLLFDRVDVLDPKSRVQFIQWADRAADHPLSIIAMATMKAKPDLSSLPNVQCEWIEGGEIAIKV